MRSRCRRSQPCVLLLALTALTTPAASITDNGHVTQVVGIAGRRVDLPCDVTPPKSGDRAVLVLWYKDDEGTPIFSFDARGGKSLSDPPAPAWGQDPRAIFVTHTETPGLRLGAAAAQDQGLYRCRVDFKHSPTNNHWVNLTVTVPPDRPIIIYNNRPVTGTLGPLAEDEPLELVCHSQGGRPAPRVTWFREERLLDDSDRSAGGDRVTNVLRLPPLGRHLLHARLVCSAANSAASPPAVNHVILDINFRPLRVEILGSPHTTFRAGKSYDLVCRTYGSRPAANVTWWIDDRRITGDKQTQSDGGNITSSTLLLRPRAGDDGRRLVCRAHNDQLADSTLEDRRTLHVRYAPLVTLKLGQALDPDDIKEGADVYFECTIRANPSVYSVLWFHDGVRLEPSSRVRGADRVSVSDDTLIVRNVSRLSAGAYVCKASNPEGDGASRPVLLRVKYAPVCVSGQRRRYSAAPGQPVQVSCRVDANPAEVTFRWRFNSSRQTLDLPSSQTTSGGLESRVSHRLAPGLEHGTLLCRAYNDIGRMVEPCVFQISAAGRPDPVRNCTIINQTADSLEVECLAGSSGGLPQYFVAELYDAAGHRLLRNITQPFPDFWVADLPAGMQLRLELYAANSRGRSRAVTLEGFTLSMPEKRTARGDATAGPPAGRPFTVTPILGVLIGLVASLVIVAIGAVLCIRRHSARRRKPAVRSDRVGKPAAGAGDDPASAQVQPLAEPAAKSIDADDLNPDVVSSAHEVDRELTEVTPMLNQLTAGKKKNNVSTPAYPTAKQKEPNLYQDDSITYAELTLPLPGLASKTSRAGRPQTAVIYSTVGHQRRPAETIVRTPPLNNDQESVV